MTQLSGSPVARRTSSASYLCGDRQRDLFVATRDVCSRSLALPRLRLPNIQQTYETLYAIHMANRLPHNEIILLGDATDFREEGFQLARQGEVEDGAELIARSRESYERAGLSAEALLLAESFQVASEAYVKFKRGDDEGAEVSLLAAIASCATLRNQWSYAVEVRRIHLACNLVRVLTNRGAFLEALSVVHHIIAYIEGDALAWPWPAFAVEKPDELTTDARWFLMDQALAEVARLLPTASPSSVGLLRLADEYDWLPIEAAPIRFDRVRHWLGARRMAVTGDLDEFMRHATAFFGEPPGRLRTAWRELTVDLSAIGIVLAPDERVDFYAD